jgi:large subunit ribosomal protein L4
MIDVKVYNTEGAEVGQVALDEAWFGTEVNVDVLRRSVRRHQAAQRVGTAKTKSRGEIAYSTKKLYAQKHTGRARAGPRASPTRRGGGHAFAKRPRDFSIGMPRRMRRAATDAALLARLKDGEVLALEGLQLSGPKTHPVAAALKACGIERSCLLVLAQHDPVLYKSARNLDRVLVRPLADLNAYELLWPHRVVFLRSALEALVSARKG